MRIKQMKIRDASGVAHYEDMLDSDSVIELVRAILKEQPDNIKCAALVGWADSLERNPTGDEFMAWMESQGAKFIPIETEPHEN